MVELEEGDIENTNSKYFSPCDAFIVLKKFPFHWCGS